MLHFFVSTGFDPQAYRAVPISLANMEMQGRSLLMTPPPQVLSQVCHSVQSVHWPGG